MVRAVTDLRKLFRQYSEDAARFAVAAAEHRRLHRKPKKALVVSDALLDDTQVKPGLEDDDAGDFASGIARSCISRSGPVLSLADLSSRRHPYYEGMWPRSPATARILQDCDEYGCRRMESLGRAGGMTAAAGAETPEPPNQNAAPTMEAGVVAAMNDTSDVDGLNLLRGRMLHEEFEAASDALFAGAQEREATRGALRSFARAVLVDSQDASSALANCNAALTACRGRLDVIGASQLLHDIATRRVFT